jgi:signal transduction histidine kinase
LATISKRNILGRVFNRVQIKYALSYIGIIAALLVFLNTFPVARLREMMAEGKYQSLQSQAALISSSIAPLSSLYAEEVARVMTLLNYPESTDVIIADASGTVIYNSNYPDLAFPLLPVPDNSVPVPIPIPAPGELLTALSGKQVFSARYGSGVLTGAFAQPIVYLNSIIGAIYLRETDTGQAAMIPSLQHSLMLLTAIILIASLAIAVLLSWIFTHRFLDLLRALKVIRSGDYGFRMPVDGSDEIAEFRTEINSLSERLKRVEELRVRFVSDASHELKTPLAGIRLLSDSISENSGMDIATIREFVSDIGVEAARLTRVTEKLLEMSKIDRAADYDRRETFDLRDTVHAALKLLNPLALHNGVTIEHHLHSVRVFADPDAAYQAVFNLIENAVKYNVANGTARISLYENGGKAVMTIDDTGVGIPEKDLPFIFDRFYRVDKARSQAAGGSGLGLSIVRDAVEKNGGSIAVRPRISGGTRFTMTLPAAK